MDEEVEITGEESKKKSKIGCSHTHSCNPPGPGDTSHSHTCFHAHTHTHIIRETYLSDNSNKKRPCGNREAVRKYREKKKARTAYLEDEARRLQDENQSLLRKIQSQEPLEAEFFRLQNLLVDMQELINGVLGSSFLIKEDECNIATRNEMCEEAKMECESQSRVLGSWGKPTT